MIRNSQNPILIIKAPRVARPLSIEWPLLESEISLSDVGLDGLESRERARVGRNIVRSFQNLRAVLGFKVYGKSVLVKELGLCQGYDMI